MNTSREQDDYQSRTVSGKNFSLASLPTICTANSPASIIAQPSFTRRFELGGRGSGGCAVNSYSVRELMSTRKRLAYAAHTVLRTIRTTDSIAPRFSVPSFTYTHMSSYVMRAVPSEHPPVQ